MRFDSELARAGRLACAFCLGACASAPRPFPPRPPLWHDHDTQAFAKVPKAQEPGLLADAVDNMLLRPISRFFAVDPGGEALNVNAVDEVPSSSFFENRIGVRDMTPEQFARGSCGDEPPLDPNGPFTVVAAKPGGRNAGFVIDDPSGRRFLIKFDDPKQPERATAADVVGSILYHAAGYHTPCNRIVAFDPKVLRVAPPPGGDVAGEGDAPPTWQDVEAALRSAKPRSDGRYRASASLYLTGKPLGPFRYEGTRCDDLNDVVPHEDRRDLRGGHVLAAWLNHYDTRAHNTLDTWIAREGGLGYVRHHYLDFSDSFGNLWGWDALSRRFGTSGYFYADQVAFDFVTLGLVERPWESARFGPAGVTFGYFGSFDAFDPDSWRPGYSNPAFSRRTERDSAWMARILARIDREQLLAAVEQARFRLPLHARELLRILQGRRERILRRYLSVLSPLTRPSLQKYDGAAVSVCLEDLATYAGVVPRTVRRYRAMAFVDGAARPLQAHAGGLDRVCAPLPAMPEARPSDPAYLVVELRGEVVGREKQEGPARVHVYDFGSGRYLVAGLERPLDSP